jgi:hypothetical protein
MKSLSKSVLLTAALVGAAMLAAPSQAHAAFQVTVFVDGVNQGVVTTGTANAFGATGTGIGGGLFNIQVTSSTNFPGNPVSGSLTNTSNNQVAAAQNFNASHVVTIVISESGWTAPVGPVVLSSSAGGSIVNSNHSTFSVTATNRGFVDNSNTLATTTTPGGTATTLANASASLADVGTTSLTYTPSPSTTGAAGGTPFTLTQVFTFTFAAGTKGDDAANVGGTVSVTAVTGVPAPPQLVLCLTALPFMGIGTWLRRRRLAA